MITILQDLLRSARLNRVSADIEGAALLSIRLRVHAIEETELTLGTTKFGGSPDLAPGLRWPERDGSLLPFIAQINLSEVISYDTGHLLPDLGILYFFFDSDMFFETWPRSQSTWSVLYHRSSLQPS